MLFILLMLLFTFVRCMEYCKEDRSRERSVVLESEERSLVFIFDTTGSMHDDYIQLRDGAGKILHAITNNNTIKNYILIPFNDPGKLILHNYVLQGGREQGEECGTL